MHLWISKYVHIPEQQDRAMLCASVLRHNASVCKENLIYENMDGKYSFTGAPSKTILVATVKRLTIKHPAPSNFSTPNS